MDWEEYKTEQTKTIENVLEAYNQWYAPGFFVPLSGGVDSSACLAFACHYADKQNWDRKNIIAATCVRDGSFDAERQDVEYARRVAKELGVTPVELDISSTTHNTEKYNERVRTLQELVPDALQELVQADHIALARTFALRKLDESLPIASLATGNLSEDLLAQWTTGCYVGQASILGQLFKTEVWEYAKHLGVPDYILDRPKIASEIKSGTNFTNYQKIDPLLFHFLARTRLEDLAGSGYDTTYAKALWKRVDEHRIRASGGDPVIEPGKPIFDHREKYSADVSTNPLVKKLHTHRQNRWGLRKNQSHRQRAYWTPGRPIQ